VTAIEIEARADHVRVSMWHPAAALARLESGCSRNGQDLENLPAKNAEFQIHDADLQRTIFIIYTLRIKPCHTRCPRVFDQTVKDLS
jgi:hypothetical protein